MTKTQEYLRTYGLQSLVDTYKIKIRRGIQYPNLICFKYDVKSPMSEQICRECRGLVLDENDDWNIVSRAYDKFFNYGEGHAATIDWETAKVFEKLDGTLCTLYFYNGSWHVSTTGTPDGSGEVNRSGLTFAQLFWRVFTQKGYELPITTYAFYVFELMTKENEILVRNFENRLVLHGVRDESEEYDEMTARLTAEVLNWEYVEQAHSLQSLQGVIDVARDLNGLESEGFVIVDANFNRIKVKSPHYISISHLKPKSSAEHLYQVALKGEIEEVITYFPQWKKELELAQEQYWQLAWTIANSWIELSEIVDQKEFALAAQKTVAPSILFALRNKKIEDVQAGLELMHPHLFMKLAQGNYAS
jgi:hypothetical protein